MTAFAPLKSLLVFLALCAAGAVSAAGPEPFDDGGEPMRYLSNGRVTLGIDLSIGGAVTWLSDEAAGGENMINSFDWGRQIQLSYYSGPVPYVGPDGEPPAPQWAALGWNPIQSGDSGGFRSKVIEFRRIGEDKMAVRTVPMLWPNKNVPAETVFECVYTLMPDGFILDATIENARSDTAQYPARDQEMPAVYTNGPWYKLVSYLGSEPFRNRPVTVLVDRNDGKGWPWLNYYSPERWSALVDENGMGLGVFQPESVRNSAGFHGGDALKGAGGAKEVQTGYIAPLCMTILDHNITRTYRTYFIVGSADEIRARVYELAEKEVPPLPEWTFDGDRRNWFYRGGVSDAGYPVRDGLEISFEAAPGGEIRGPETFWTAEDAPVLEIDAELSVEGAGPGEPVTLPLRIVPFSPRDTVDIDAWPLNPEHEKKRAEKFEQYPVLPEIPAGLSMANGQRRVWTADLRNVEGYAGAMKSLAILTPPRKGKLNLYGVRLRRAE